MTQPRILVAGIGNIFLGDDAFGVEVVRQMIGKPLPDGVRVTDFGIRGLDLTYALLEDYDAVILVDATQQGGEPGTIYVMEPDVSESVEQDVHEAMVETHAMNPMKVLRMARAMGGRRRRLLLVGCEPAVLESEEGYIGLSEAVQAAVDEAVEVIVSLVETLCAGQSEMPAERVTPERNGYA